MKLQFKIGIQLTITMSAIIYLILMIDLREFKLAWASVTQESLYWVLILLSSNIIVTAFRLQKVLSGLGYNIPYRQVVNAHIVSQIAGALFFQLIGQTISRATLLSDWKVDNSVAFVVSLVERVIVGTVAALLCAIGVLALFGGFSPLEGFGPNYLVKSLIIICAVSIVVVRTSGSTYIKWLRINVLQHIIPKQLAVASLITLVGQILVSFSYVIIANNLADGTLSINNLLFASFIIMFAAAIPISFAGWGVRELGAVWVLGTVGMPQPQAAFVAVLIGVMSLLLLCVPLPLTLIMKKSIHAHDDPIYSESSQRKVEYNKAVLLGLPLICSVLVFFQVRLPVLGGEISVNIADPVAIAAGLFVIWELIRKKRMPSWQASVLNKVFIVITILLSLSLLIGIYRFGLTTWAFSNRYIGWFVLLAYLLTGGLAGGFGGIGHRQAVLRALITTGVFIALCEWGLMILKAGGIIQAGTGWIGYNLEGFVQNRNAFAFQMLTVLSVSLACHTSSRSVGLGALASVVTAIVWTGSRAGLIVLTVMIVFAWRRKLLDFPGVSRLPVYLAGMILMPYCLAWLAGVSLQNHIQYSSPASDSQHFQTILLGIQMWLEYPLSGAGLGAFIREWHITHGAPLVIHNIYVWMLAETGLLGFVAFLGLIISVLRLVVTGQEKCGFSSAERSSVILLMTCMLVVGMFHDMLYQRLFWFASGLLLMTPSSLGEPSESLVYIDSCQGGSYSVEDVSEMRLYT